MGWLRLHWDLMIDSWKQAIKKRFGLVPKTTYVPDEATIQIVEELVASCNRLERENYILRRQLEVSRAHAKGAQERFFIKNTPVTWIKDDYDCN